jgi:hypothetical protein
VTDDIMYTCPVCGLVFDFHTEQHTHPDGEVVWTQDLVRFWTYRRWEELYKEQGG